MKIFILIVLTLIISLQSFTQEVECEWILSAGSNWEEYPYVIDNDSSGNCYMLFGGVFQSFMIDTIQITNQSMVVVNDDGSAINSIVVDFNTYNQKFKYRDGIMSANFWWLLSPNQFGNTSGIVGFGQQDAAIWKYDINDNPLWVKVFGGTGNDWAVDFEYDNNNNLYVIGEFESPSISFGSSIVNNPNGIGDIFLAKYDSIGNQDWLISGEMSSISSEPKKILIDNYGYVYISGIFYSSFTFANISLTPTLGGGTFLVKIDSNGNGVWGKSIEGFITDMKMDTENNLVIIGWNQSSTLFMIDNDTVWTSNTGLNARHFFAAKLDTVGNIIWTNFGYGSECYCGYLAIDNNNDIYLLGGYSNWLTSLIQLDTFTLPYSAYQNSFVAKYSSSGDVLWVKNIAGEYNRPRDISIYDNDIYLCGDYAGELSIDNDTVYGHFAWTDIFLAKISQNYPEPASQSIDLVQGWSIISTFIDIDIPNLDSVFIDIDTNLIIMKDEAGLVYWPIYGINNIGDLTIGEGYIVKMDAFNILEVTGVAVVPEVTSINLQAGWNIMAYLRQSSGDIDSMLTGISNIIIMVKNDLGLVYWPMYSINNIGNMYPGEGYPIKMEDVATLVYPAN